MIRPSGIRFLKRAIAGLLAVLMLVQATGCTTWRTVSLSVAAVESPKNKVKVVLKEGGTVTSDSVRARGDTVATYQQGGTSAIPLDKVAAIKVRRSSAGKTVGLILGIGAALFAAMFAWMVASLDDS